MFDSLLFHQVVQIFYDVHRSEILLKRSEKCKIKLFPLFKSLVLPHNKKAFFIWFLAFLSLVNKYMGLYNLKNVDHRSKLSIGFRDCFVLFFVEKNYSDWGKMVMYSLLLMLHTFYKKGSKHLIFITFRFRKLVQLWRKSHGMTF